MNKRDAKTKSQASEISIGELRSMISTARQRGGMSRVNPAVSLEQACDIYERSLAGRDDAEIPAGMRVDPYSSRGAMKPSRDSLIIKNILWDCAP